MTSRPRQKRAPASALEGDGARSSPRVIRKYPNRRLYDTVESRYVTLDEIARWVRRRSEELGERAGYRAAEGFRRVTLAR